MMAEFAGRHIGPQSNDLAHMLQAVGVDSLDQLVEQTVPQAIRNEAAMEIAPAMTESDFLRHMHGLSQKNKIFATYIGQGYHPSVTPAVIQRNILENPGWYTAYTPYQAEIAQGRLEALVNFQTMVIDLTGMEITNASLLDESTAAAEAMSLLMAARSREQQKRGANKFFVDQHVFGQTLGLLKTRATPMEIDLVIGDLASFAPTSDFFGALLQYPNADGQVHDPRALIAACKEQEVRVAVAADLLSLSLLTPPGEWGADVVLGTTQRFGIPMGFGGPHAAYFASKDEYKRFMPGRIIGRTLDTDGNSALRMALQTREQHIKRDRATSNICTSQVLLAVMAGMYGVYHGPDGLKRMATRVHQRASGMQVALQAMGYTTLNSAFFDTLHVAADDRLLDAVKRATIAAEINIGYSVKGFLISTHEVMNDADAQALVHALASAKGVDAPVVGLGEMELPSDLLRTSPYMTHPVFSSYRSETEMMRYIKKLERRDIALNHSMIPLGSCTMKLNAAAEMLPLSWPAFGQVHPFAPLDQAAGYMEVIRTLEKDLAVVTGFDATSLQPNSGAQGEYAGLLVIRSYHHARGDFHRKTALIPSSAHGTNPASAVMAGMDVVVVACDEKGNIDLADLRAKAEKHSDTLSALMITYPSTHGVFEAGVKEATSIIHAHGGQVYMDGANMNAQVGLTSPGNIGADVCHLNLHKTFAIPHGGGGPGVGPICVKAHLAPYLPGHSVHPTGGEAAMGAVSAAPYGSALVLLISYGYVKMLGPKGLTNSTKYAILNANYIKSRLEQAYPVLYAGENGRCAHEMILDCRPFKREAGIEVTDIAKRLMDYGYHAPTVSFPVAGTVMVEPTESESLAELDRFCDAMLAIKAEIDQIVRGDLPKESNPLKNAPHTLAMVTADKWELPYSRQIAAYPLPELAENKFWPAVRRVDDAYGDRNLICTCAPIEAYSA
ncbi:MAG TPA: glycine dehydrogenase (aminomethyl-transferring) [Cryomorphaceae bacterium]|jgi:glycine dehydrogenase|nr:MAG: glycine dehydrogenase [Cryomorphaceae bacterium BACL7 MAG-120910-bin2]KRO68434.1 MAG: glycine dehydrogenase [Cryomorphaceae bacterium BACL7 MAG-120322-bin74]KRO84132.1 MAG: glycine dehydrogenase [Cryomorphaceae bacterium BACL7 MAG-121220-bin83]NQW24839.1 aminomethyl-transferring glycine dehydrogenase [Cryomorphaceae bacterium]HAB32335.1 glycine dehydrogenase (aminomethyl-transferring) [Cryomorphaceae bacterium]